ncbi:MAG TPA: SPFH domain-containing protein [Nocardioides sp.]|nr:SPFH domain-containing protein [Nocardioides sp.]
MTPLRPRITVQPWTVVLEHVPGRAPQVLAAGRHRSRRGARYEVVDLRDRSTSLVGEEVSSEDGLAVRASVTVRWRVSDPVLFGERAAEHVAAVCLATKVTLREVVGRLPGAAVAEAVRTASADRITAEVRPVAARGGVDVLAVEVHDLVLPDTVAGPVSGRVSGQVPEGAGWQRGHQ